MWRLALVIKRGLKSSGTGIENRSGHRNAVVKTLDGKLWHISDKQFCTPYFDRGPVPRLQRDRNGPFPFPRRDQQWVIINVTKATKRHGKNPEPTQWMLASMYWRALGQCLAASEHVTHVAQPGMIGLIRDYMRDNFGPTTRDEWLDFERRKIAIARQGVSPGYMELAKSYFLFGHNLCTATSLLE